MLNNVVLLGRLVREPELRYTNNGTATATFTLAVERRFKNQNGDKEADFIPIVVWKQAAENCGKYLKKGNLCAVEGRIQTRNYEKDGKKVYITEVVADNVRFLERNETQGQQDPFENEQPIDISDDDLPF